MALSASGAVGSKVTVSIGFSPPNGDPFFKGRVSSGRQSCVAGRSIVVYRVGNQDSRVRFGSTRTDSGGLWRLAMTPRMKTAGYVAKVKATGACRTDDSEEIAVGQKGIGGNG